MKQITLAGGIKQNITKERSKLQRLRMIASVLCRSAAAKFSKTNT